MPLAMSRAAEIEAVMPPIAVQSIFLSTLSGNGCVGAPMVARRRVGVFFSLIAKNHIEEA